MTEQKNIIPLAPEERSFKLSYSGISCKMTRPKVKQQMEALRQDDAKNDEEVAMIVISKCTTFDGESMNWNDLGNLYLSDWYEVIKVYRELTSPPKKKPGSTEEEKNVTTQPQ